ncbi:C-terminal binding protein [Mycobacterium aquaticum]|nr:C-terminal binding protein [Mycobacterium aquaticum]
MVITDHAFAGEQFERDAAAELGAEFDVYNVSTEAAAANAVRGADIALVNFAPMTESVLQQMNPGAVVVRYGIGYDNVDLNAARAQGIRVCNVPDYGADTVADHAVTVILALIRKVHLFSRAIAAGDWPSATALAPIRSMAETTVGLLGTGRIGMAVANRLLPFGFKILAYDPYANAESTAERGVTLVDLDELFERSNVLSLHAPATPETTGIVSTENLAKMPKGSFLVNTSRGALVDQDAVLEALNSGQLAGAALDVFVPEVLPTDHPLRSHPNALLTPHAAFYSEQSLRDLQRLAAEEALRAGRGEPLRCPVN